MPEGVDQRRTLAVGVWWVVVVREELVHWSLPWGGQWNSPKGRETIVADCPQDSESVRQNPRWSTGLENCQRRRRRSDLPRGGSGTGLRGGKGNLGRAVDRFGGETRKGGSIRSKKLRRCPLPLPPEVSMTGVDACMGNVGVCGLLDCALARCAGWRGGAEGPSNP